MSATCAAPTSPQNPTIPAISWNRQQRGCSIPFPKQGGCEAGNICAKIPTTPFNGRLCIYIYKTGDQTCPVTTYTEKSAFSTSTTDNRSCSACTCRHSLDGTLCTNGSISAYTDANCTVGAGTAPTPCVNVTGNARWVKVAGTVPPGGSCGVPSNAGKPTGGATATGPVTVCCTP